MNKEILKATHRGIEFLSKRQSLNGSFPDLTSPERERFDNAIVSESFFPTALILSCLCAVSAPSLLKKTADFVLSQKSEQGTFNYWVRQSESARKTPYPDDLDDTSCALAALIQYNPKLVDGEVIAKVVTVLTALEKEEGGPYRTWLVPLDAKEVWRDIDFAVNCNIAYFLLLQEVDLPKLTAFMESAINQGAYESPYYPSQYPIIYFLSRAYQGKKKDKVVQHLIANRDTVGIWENPLYTALSISALLNLGVAREQVQPSIEYLLKQQQVNGGWSAYAFYIGSPLTSPEGRKTGYTGSECLTTAFCLEALSKYAKLTQKDTVAEPKKLKDNKQSEEIYEEVMQKARERSNFLSDDLKRQMEHMVGLMQERDKQIVLMPYFFAASLKKEGKGIPHNFLVQICLANLYGWIAYTIYDDFLDEEGDPKLLSTANLALRELTTIYRCILPSNVDFQKLFGKIMDTIDEANTWEVYHCRMPVNSIPDYGDFSKLAERSLGHALGPIAILFSLGYSTSSYEVQNLMKFFMHYLISKQLSDDMHDWSEDFKKGHINAIAVLILKHKKAENLLSEKHEQMQRLSEIFWYDVVESAVENMLAHGNLARQSLHKISLIDDYALLEQVLLPIEIAGKKTITERNKTLKFLNAYGR